MAEHGAADQGREEDETKVVRGIAQGVRLGKASPGQKPIREVTSGEDFPRWHPKLGIAKPS